MYPLPILDIWDFDQTITIHHTAGNQEIYEPKTNTKSGLDGKVTHNNKRFCAVATFHKDPGYVLSYFLPLFKLNEADIETEKTEVLSFEHHQLTKIYFRDRSQPFIIATPLLENYEFHVKALFLEGKNEILKSLCTALPPCAEYHYYDDSEKCYLQSMGLGYFHSYFVDKDAPHLTFKKAHQPSVVAELRNTLNAYKQLQENSENASESKPETPLVALSFLVNSLNSEKGKEPELKQPTDLTSLQVVNHLLTFLNSSSTAEIAHLEVLAQGELGLMIKDWEIKRGVSLSEFIAELRKEKLAMQECVYVSDDEFYENVEGLKLS
ncbi:hypothetical protein [Legionella sp.]|uniref:hypothetical protein n=1 Tax=Legionella sp. TaxID=459 RepID=UPI00322043D2